MSRLDRLDIHTSQYIHVSALAAFGDRSSRSEETQNPSGRSLQGARRQFMVFLVLSCQRDSVRPPPARDFSRRSRFV
jgi:hypothetical protein